MVSTALAHLLLPLIIAVSIVLMLIRPRGIPEVYWIGGGALLLIFLRLVPLSLAGRAVAQGSDVYLFLIGMMLLSELARERGVFDWLSSVAVRSANGSCWRLFTLVYGVGTVVTIFISNDATAVVLTPAILTAVRKAKVEPLPYLFVCALIANAASFVLPISNPANLVVFHNGMPPLGQWLLSFGVPSVLSIVATYAIMRVIFREYLCAAIDGEVQAAPLNGDGKLVLAGLAVMVLVLLTASSLKKDLGLPACLAALAITAAVSIKAESNPLRLARDISWGTLVLVAGLFIMVDAAENIGALKLTQAWLAWAQKLAPVAGAFITGFAVGVSKQFGQQSSAWTDRWWQSSGGARERSDRQCHTHRCRFGAELISYGLTGDDSMAACSAQGKARCELLEFPQGWGAGDARRSISINKRRHRYANALSDLVKLSLSRTIGGTNN